MKILVISESINVDDSSASKVNVALITNIVKTGNSVKVLHYSHRIINLPNIECELIKENKFSVFYFLSRFVRVFQRINSIMINEKLEYLFGFSFTHSNDTNSIARAINKEKYNYDIILTLSKGGSFRPHRAMLKLPKLQKKWIAYIHDPYPFHFYPRPFNWVETSYKSKENFMKSVVSNANYLAFPSKLLKEWMQSYLPEVMDKSIIIPHQINVQNSNADLPDFFIKNQFSLLHAGNLLLQRNPAFLVKAFINFLDNNEEAKLYAKLYLIGNYYHHEQLLKPYIDHPNIIIKNYIDYSSIQKLEENTTVTIILESISEISPFLPGKFPNCVIANKPIIVLGPYYSEVKRLLGNDYPYWSEANDIEKIESIISSLYQIWKINPNKLTLERPDLIDYCNEVSLKKVLQSI